MVTRSGKAYEIWWAAVEARKSSRRYRIDIEDFLNWMGWEYEDLFNNYLGARRSTDPRDVAQITGKIVAFYRKKRSEGWSPGYAKNAVKPISSFFTENGVTLEFSKSQKKEMTGHTIHEKDLFSKDELRSLIAATTHPRNKAIVHLLKDSGMPVSDAADLNVGDVKRALDNGDRFLQIEYIRNKTGVNGTPCLGPEALGSLRDWMRWRVNKGISSATSDPLFTEIKGEKTGGRMNGDLVGDVVGYMAKKAGLSDKNLTAHGLRVYHASQLESAGVNRNVIYRMEARLIPDSGRVYSKGDVLSSYIKAYEALAVQGTKVVEVQDSRVAEMEAKMEKMEKALMEIYEREKPTS